MANIKLLYKYLKENKVLDAYTSPFHIEEFYIKEYSSYNFYIIQCYIKPYYKRYSEKMTTHVSVSEFNAWLKKSRLDTLNEILE
jgi:hypothetical protein